MNLAQQRAQEVIKQHGGVLKASRALRINKTVLSLLASGDRTSASPKTLRLLGVKKVRRVEHVAIA